MADVYGHFHDLELWEFGSTMSLAMNSPKDLKKLEPKKTYDVDMEQLPGMLRIPKKRT